MLKAIHQLEGSWHMYWRNLSQATGGGEEGKETLFKKYLE